VPQIDRLLSLLVQSRAAAVELLDGEPAAFVTGTERRAATRQPLAAAQILAFVREIAPPAVAAGLGALQPAEFAYTSADGTFAVQVSRFGDRWGATLTPAAAPVSAAPAAVGTRPCGRGRSPPRARRAVAARARGAQGVRPAPPRGGAAGHPRER
jgi:hypothetical protein